MWLRVSLFALLVSLAVALKKDCPKPCIPIDQCPELARQIQTNVRVVQEATCEILLHPVPLVCCPSATHEPLKSSSTTSKPPGSSTTSKPPGSSTTRKPPGPNLLLPKNCGHFSQDDRIHGGNETRLGNYPWMAALGFRNSFTNKIDFLCGGSVISERYILSAAHCFGTLEEIRLREWKLSTDVDCETSPTGFKFCAPGPALKVEYEEIISHPDYNKRGANSDDIALIRLSEPIQFNQWVQPVCLPERDLDVSAALGERRAVVTGWGFTENRTTSDILLEVALPQVDIESCKRTYKAFNTELVDNQLCFGGIEGMDSCGGDSGGPLMMSEFSAPPYTQIGVVSFGPRDCGRKDVPGVYASVSGYRDWIDETMRP